MHPYSKDYGRGLGVSLAVGTLALMSVTTRASTNPTDQNVSIIEVSGTGKVLVDPDRATLTVAVESSGPSASAAASENARVTAAVRSALIQSGAREADVVTGSYTVAPQYHYSSNAPPQRSGYEALMSLRVTVDRLSELGPWIDAALAAGASRVQDIEFGSRNASHARQEALAQAVSNARADAEALAKAASGKLGALQEIRSQAPNVPRPMLPVAAMTVPNRAQTQIEPTPLDIEATITARWTFEP